MRCFDAVGGPVFWWTEVCNNVSFFPCVALQVFMRKMLVFLRGP